MTTMAKQGAAETYINEDVVSDLAIYGAQGGIMSNIISDTTVAEAVRMINIIACKEKMYPEVPFANLTCGDISDTVGVIIGGMPDISNLDHWTGAGYSYYRNSGIFSKFHEFASDELADTVMATDLKEDCDELQSEGVLILHEAMSCTKESSDLCATAWEPIIWFLLNSISNLSPQVPILFTTPAAYDKFASACGNSKHVLTANIDKAGKHSVGMLFIFEQLCNRALPSPLEISILESLKPTTKSGN